MESMSTDLKGKVAVVTGGARGIGRAITESLLREGASVAFCARSQERVDQAQREFAAASSEEQVMGAVCDVSRYEQVREFFQAVNGRFGQLDVLVNNAGVGAFRPVEQMSPEEWDQIIHTNLSGVFYCSHEAIPLMKNHGGGLIINIGSLAGRNAFPGGAAYNASKFGLLGFTEAMMQDVRQDGIRVSTIMPGSVQTEFGGTPPGGDWKIDPAHIGETVLYLLRLPERSLASRIEMRPSKPPQKK